MPIAAVKSPSECPYCGNQPKDETIKFCHTCNRVGCSNCLPHDNCTRCRNKKLNQEKEDYGT